MKSVADSIMESHQSIPTDNLWQRWTGREDDYLTANWGKVSQKDMAKRLGRTRSAVNNRGAKLGLSAKSHEWCPDEIAALEKLWPVMGIRARDILVELGYAERSERSVDGMAQRLNLRMQSSLSCLRDAIAVLNEEPRRGSAPKAPDASRHDPRPEYLRALLDQAGMSQREAARRIGITDRALRYYAAGERSAPYPVQFALEQLASK